jgi:uncharacterized protein YbaP (TraB family)
MSGKSHRHAWRASSDRGTFYIQGSVHLLKAKDYPLDPAIEEAYSKSATIVFETDMAAMMSMETQQLIMQRAILPGARKLEDELDPEVYAQLAAKLAEAGLPEAMVRKFKPWFATMTLMIMRMQAIGLDPNHGLDQYFHKKAAADGKPEVALETVEFQINLFDALSEGDQNGYTKHALKELHQIETLLDEMISAWKIGDLARLDTIVQESFADYPEMYGKFVTERNRAWAEKLDGMADKEKTCMVIVGTAHLGGKEGLLELMKARGFTLKQL